MGQHLDRLMFYTRLFMGTLHLFVGTKILIIGLKPLASIMLDTTLITNRRRFITRPDINNLRAREMRGLRRRTEGWFPPESDPVYLSARSALERLIQSMHTVVKPPQPHLVGIHWEVFMARPTHVKYISIYPTIGKIVICDEKAQVLTDDQLAHWIAMMVGHSVLQHTREDEAKLIMRNCMVHVASFFWLSVTVKSAIALSQRFEMRSQRVEADHVGLLLAASAGYHPRGAVEAIMNLRQFQSQRSLVEKIFNIRPSLARRAQALLRSNVMKEAQAIYDKARNPSPF